MTIIEKYIINTYSMIFENMNSDSKIDLLQKLVKSLKIKDTTDKQKDFFSSFGGFVSNKSAEEIITEIRNNRNFNRKNMEF